MRMLCAAEPGTLAPPQPWRGAELFSLAAGVGVNAAKPHQGLASKKAALHQGQIARNSTTALELSWSWQSGTAPGAGVTYDYDAWGNTINSTGSTPNVYLYRGEQYDQDLNLYYLRARYLNPLTGRFMTRDSVDGGNMYPATLHKYLYAADNPVDLSDPSGLTPITDSNQAGVLVFDPFTAGGVYAMSPGRLSFPQPFKVQIPLGRGGPVYKCCRTPNTGTWADRAASMLNLKHCWLKTDAKAGGMGPADPGPLPGNPLGVRTKIVDAKSEVGHCELQPDVSDKCVNDSLQIGRGTGRWFPWNNCNTFVSGVLFHCRYQEPFGGMPDWVRP